MIEHPLDLGRGEIRVDNETGFLSDHIGQPVRDHLIGHRRGSPVLPHDRPGNRFSRVPVPDNRGFTLVCDADRRDVISRRPDFVQRFGRDRILGQPDFVRIMLDKSRLREILGEFLLDNALDLAFFIKQNTAV